MNPKAYQRPIVNAVNNNASRHKTDSCRTHSEHPLFERGPEPRIARTFGMITFVQPQRKQASEKATTMISNRKPRSGTCGHLLTVSPQGAATSSEMD